MKTCLIIQSGAMGDIFVVAPIAKFYFDRGYLVYWPVRSDYYETMKYFPYINRLLVDPGKYPPLDRDWLRSDSMHLEKITGHYDLVLNLADRSMVTGQHGTETFEEYKYRKAGVPFELKHHLVWKRNMEREIRHYNDLVPEDEDYILVHTTSSRGDHTIIPETETRHKVEADKVEGFYIPDLYRVILGAKAIYCVESAIHQFIDGMINQVRAKGIPCYLLSRPTLRPGERYTKSEYWDKTYMM